MTQEHYLYILLVFTMAASIVIQVLVALILRELFYYMRGSYKGIYDRMDYIVGGVDIIKEQQGHLHKRISEIFRAINRGRENGE